jgi:hypothetical protein
MPRPTNKATLLELSQKNFDMLFDFIDKHSEADQNKEFPLGTMNRNIRDVLGHLYHWQKMMQLWYETGMSGQKPDIPAKGYTWKTVPELNRKIWEQYSPMPLSELKSKLKDSHVLMMEIIKNHTDEELFEKKRYPWTGTTSLGAYFIGVTSSHYDWALKLISKSFKKM